MRFLDCIKQHIAYNIDKFKYKIKVLGITQMIGDLNFLYVFKLIDDLLKELDGMLTHILTNYKCVSFIIYRQKRLF